MKIKKFTIDEICALVEMNKRTVRYYIQKGLVDRPEGIGKGAFYSHAHLEQLLAIRKWKAAGLSLERIQDILAGEKDGGTGDKPASAAPAQKTGSGRGVEPYACRRRHRTAHRTQAGRAEP